VLQEYLRHGSRDGGAHGHALVGLVSLTLEGEIVLIEDDLKGLNYLIGGLYVIIFQELAFDDVNGFTYGDIDIKVFDVHGYVGCDFKVCHSIGHSVRIGGGVLVFKV